MRSAVDRKFDRGVMNMECTSVGGCHVQQRVVACTEVYDGGTVDDEMIGGVRRMPLRKHTSLPNCTSL